MTTRPNPLQTARSDGYLVTHTDWNFNVLQEGNYAFEVLAGSNADKIAIGSVQGVQGYYDNLLVNGGFEVWQRGAGPFTANGAMLADGWLLSFATSTISVSQGAATVPNSKYMASGTYTQVSTGQGQVLHKIENFAEYAGRTLTFSVVVYCATGGGAYLQLYDGITAVQSGRSVAGQFTTLQCTLAFNNAPTVGWASVVFDTTSGTTTFAVDNAILVEGSVTGLTYVALPPDQEMERCMRHYQKVVHSQRFRATAASEFRDVGVIYPVRMMAAPTVTLTTTGTRGNIASATVADINADGHRYELAATATTTDTFSIEDQFTLVIEP